MKNGFISAPRSEEGAGLWFIKVFSGVLIIVILVIHLVVNHLIAEGGLLSFADVVRYYQNPIIPIMEIAFLIFVVSHALIGLRTVILDLKPSQAAMRWINRGLLILGVGSIVYGIWLVFAIIAQG